MFPHITRVDRIDEIMCAICEDEAWQAGLVDWQRQVMIDFARTYLITAMCNEQSLDEAQVVIERTLNAVRSR